MSGGGTGAPRQARKEQLEAALAVEPCSSSPATASASIGAGNPNCCSSSTDPRAIPPFAMIRQGHSATRLAIEAHPDLRDAAETAIYARVTECPEARPATQQHFPVC